MAVMSSRFGEWMRRVRTEERGMTQVELAQRATLHLKQQPEDAGQKLSGSYLSNVENGRREVRPEVAEAIAVALGKPKDLALFMAGFIPARWVAGSIAEVTERFFVYERIAMGQENIVIRGGQA